MKKIHPGVVARILLLRNQGLTREQIQAQTGHPMGGIKSILSKNKLVLPMEQRQANAYKAKLAKSPDAMKSMRLSLTPDVVERRSESIRAAYLDVGLRALKGEQSKLWWAGLSTEERDSLAQTKKGHNSIRVQHILATEGFEDMAERCAAMAQACNGIFVGPYIHSHVKSGWTCSKGHAFQMQPYVVTNGHWCPSCACVGPSKGELEVLAYVQTLAPEAASTRAILDGQELDIYVPSACLGIEYDGLYSHSTCCSGDKVLGRHREKALRCRQAGVKLLAIFEDEWKSKPELIRAMIRWRLGKFNGTSLDARKLDLRRLEKNKDFESFFDRNHLDGHTLASHALGLFLGDNLVCCASFRTNANGEFELARMATDYNYNVRGGAGRLLGQVDRPLVSFSNNRLGFGNVYSKLGFQLLQENDSGYWYTDLKTRISRWKCMRINDPSLLARYPEVPHTERDQAEAGMMSGGVPLWKIEDYGHRKWLRPGMSTEPLGTAGAVL